MEETAKTEAPAEMSEVDFLKWQLNQQNIAFAEEKLERAQTEKALWQMRAAQVLNEIVQRYGMKDGDSVNPQTRTIVRAHGKLEAVK